MGPRAGLQGAENLPFLTGIPSQHRQVCSVVATPTTLSKVVDKVKTRILCSVTSFPKIVPLMR